MVSTYSTIICTCIVLTCQSLSSIIKLPNSSLIQHGNFTSGVITIIVIQKQNTSNITTCQKCIIGNILQNAILTPQSLTMLRCSETIHAVKQREKLTNNCNQTIKTSVSLIMHKSSEQTVQNITTTTVLSQRQPMEAKTSTAPCTAGIPTTPDICCPTGKPAGALAVHSTITHNINLQAHLRYGKFTPALHDY